MALGTGANEIFDFGAALYVKAAVVVSAHHIFNIAFTLCRASLPRISGKKVLISHISVLLLMTLGVNEVHAYASAAGISPVIAVLNFSITLPIECQQVDNQFGIVSESNYLSPDMGNKEAFNNMSEYPKHPIKETGINGKADERHHYSY